MSGGASLPTAPSQAYTFQNQPGADTGAFAGIGGINTNPNAGYSSGLSTLAGTNLTNAANQILPLINQTAQTAYDPQQALYAKLQQQNQDQTNAINAQSGVAATPYGAGLGALSNQNFNLDWQNAQLGRQQTGANTIAQLLGAAGQGATTGTNIGQSVSTFNNQALQQQIADYLAYLGGGTSATNAATGQYGAESSAALQNQQLSNQAFGGLGQLGGTLLAGPNGLFGML